MSFKNNLSHSSASCSPVGMGCGSVCVAWRSGPGTSLGHSRRDVAGLGGVCCARGLGLEGQKPGETGIFSGWRGSSGTANPQRQMCPRQGSVVVP